MKPPNRGNPRSLFGILYSLTGNTSLARKRLIRDHLVKWEAAYTRWGTGSAKERAYDLELIYNLAVPVGEINDDTAYEFLMSVVELIGDSVRAKGGDLW